MPTLRRSKSLNDKISRQKNRTGDVVRDPRSPDVEGRTRTCVDNFQALVHLRKQTEDKARQLELAFNYATNGHTYLRRGPSGGVELPYPSSSITPTAKSNRHPDPPESKPPVPVVPRRQHSAEGRADRSSVLRRQESFSENPTSSRHQSRREQRKGQRPMSMVEPLASGLFPTQEELTRKDQVIQNLTESQRSLNAHNQQLLGKIDELEFENHRLRDLLSAHNVHYGTYSQAQFPGTRPHRSISFHGDALRVSGSHAPANHVLVSPHSETSVSGYGSLADSPSGEGFVAGPEARETRKAVGVEEEDDDTLPLSGVSECSLEYKNDTLEKTSSSTTSSRASRAATLNSDRSERDSTSGGKASGGAVQGGAGEGNNARIEELAKQVAELSSQRDTVILRYKQLVEESLRVLKRDKRVREELGGLLEKHGDSLKEDLKSELQILQEQLNDLTEDVEVEVQRVLSALDSSNPGSNQTESATSTMDSQVQTTLDRLVDLIGPDYQRLGRRLMVPQQELDTMEKNIKNLTPAHKTQSMLRAWLKRRGGAGPAGIEIPPAARHLVQALRDVDKDVQHCQQSTVSGPERQALRNCLQLAMDHVADPRDVLDHLIALNELTPAGIAFVQEVLEKRERAVCRLWHVSEYRGTGMVSRLALALDRSHYPQVAHRLRDELEIQNSRLHTQCHPAGEDPPSASSPAPVSSSVPAPSVEPHASASQARSRPISRVPRLRSKTFDSMSPPAKSPPASEGSLFAARKDRPTPLRPVSMIGTEKEGIPRQKERPTSAILKERTAPTVTEDKNTPAPKKNGRQTSQQERRALPVPRERSFSPFHKNKSALSQREKPAAHKQNERPLSPLVKDSDKPDSAAKTEKPVLYSQRDRPFSPFEKDKSARPFSPFEKDKVSRPFSPFEKDKPPRPFSPESNKPARSSSPFTKQKAPAAGRSGLQMQRERPFSPFQKDRAVTSFQKERAASNTHREKEDALPQSEKQTPTPREERAAPHPPKSTQAVWDKRSTASSNVGATTASGARKSVVLEQGGKISRV